MKVLPETGEGLALKWGRSHMKLVKVCFFQGDLHQPIWPVVCSEAIIAVKVHGIFLDLHQIIDRPSPKIRENEEV